MTNFSNHLGYPGKGAPAGPPGAARPGADRSNRARSKRSRSLWAVVAILGAAAFAVNFGSPVLLGFPVRLAVFAATVAGVGLLPAQSSRGWVVLTLAVSGFLDAMAIWIAAGESGWALTVIMVLNALQALAALGALLQEPAAPSLDSSPHLDYSNYAQLAAAYQAYAMQYHAAPSQQTSMAQADVQARATADSSARGAGTVRVAAPTSLETLQARYQQYDGVAADRRTRRSAMHPTIKRPTDPGLPGTDRSAPDSIAYQGRWDSSGTGGQGSVGH
jgi:hypothetical protein